MVGEPDDAEAGHWRDGSTDEALARFAAEARVGEAVRARSRERWMRQQATGATTVAGVCWSLAEAGQPLMVTTVAGRSHQGLVRSLGGDFVGLAGRNGSETLVPFAMVASIAPGRGACPTGRPVRAGVRLCDALADLAGERPLVRIWCLGGNGAIGGELVGASDELVLVRTEPPRHPVIYVRLASLCELSLTASG
jgi:hypothetical protein